MKVKTYRVLLHAVEEGVAYGWQRAHKHTDTPSDDDIKERIETEVLNAICEWFDFDDPDDTHEEEEDKIVRQQVRFDRRRGKNHE